MFSSGFSQERPMRTPATLPVRQDSIQKPPARLQADTTRTKADSVKRPQPKSDIETTIIYSARDSINSNLQSKIIKLYGDAHVKYGDIELQAEEIVIDYEQSTITAHSRADSTGRHIGYPIFTNGGEKYETKDMLYNFKTRKAKITEVVTKQGDGFLHGDVVYKNEKNELFTIGNAYTTCDLAHPHFRIISKKVKAIPGDKMVSGPFYMEFNDVPTPLGFAFGIFPAPKKSASGILVPSYGEERRRGFFLRQGGYFFDVSEYVKVALTGDVYSKGGSAITLNSNYNKRYYHTGSFNFTFTNNVNNDRIESPTKSKDFRLSWSHSPQTKGTGRFSASVNAASSSYNTNNFLGVNSNFQSTRIDQTTQNLSSNINYSKTFPGTPFSLGLNLRHNQNLGTKQVDLPLPDMSFNVNNIYPFKKMESMFLQNLNVRYSMNGTNQLTNNLGRIRVDQNGILQDSIAPFTFENLPLFLRNSKKGIRHNVPISTSFRAFKFFTISPNLSYDERWYFDKLDWNYIDSTRTFVSTKVQGFNRVYNYSGGVSMTTRIYGTYVSRNPNSTIRAFRHVINPSVGYSFQPDFATEKYDYYQRFVTTDGAGNQTVQYKARHEGYLYGTAGQGRSSAMSFSINNNVEMKVRNAKDTVDRKIALFNTLSLGSSYNFLAESFRLAPIGLAANTNILQDKINLNFSATLDPYQYRKIITDYTVEGCVGCIIDRNSYEGDPALLIPIYSEKRIDAYAWNAGKIGRITRANFAFSTNLNPKGQKSDNTTRDKIGKSEMSESDKKFLMQNPDAYVDFSVPWNLRISYNVDYTHNENQSPLITQAARFNGDISLTDKWKITYNSGYDFQNKEFTQTQIGINRDLHCWQMSLGWTPFGRFQSYNFSIGVKSALLRDLKLDRQRNFFDN
ncbi:MAG: LPS-assembly protein LptD [Cyclobacteriaceae bacterium]|nr:LPS-assembly protein LptD [Cyclobacteriaceae bacterium]